MADPGQTVELRLEPISGTVETGTDALLPLIRDTLRQSGQERLLTDGELSVKIDRNLPIAGILVVVIKVLTPLAGAVLKEALMPVIREHFFVHEEPPQDTATPAR